MTQCHQEQRSHGLTGALVRGLVELRGPQGLRFLRDLTRALTWQALGKLLQVIGMGYAFRCLGPEYVGLSGTVIVAAMYGQLVLDLGLEIISVRHVAARTVKIEDLIPATFTLRAIIAAASALVWLGGLLPLPMDSTTRWVWALGAPHLFFLGLNFSWFYQATERVSQFALVQNLTTVATSVYFLVFFHPGQAAGSDLLVTMLMNGLATALVWWQIQRAYKVKLFQLSSLALAMRLSREGRPTWSFNLCYSALASVSLPLCYWLLGQRDSGYYRASAMIVFSLQVFLAYIAFMLNPRIVAWRNRAPDRFRPRVLLVVGAVIAAGVIAFACLWLIGEPVIRLLCGREFLPAALILPALVFAKFLAVGSGLLVWAFFACQRDWLGAACCIAPLVAGVVLSVVLIPRFGILAAAWLYWLMEFGLLVTCLVVFLRLKTEPVPPQ